MEVVSNSSPLISFAAMGHLKIMRELFPKGVLIPRKVWEEVLTGNPGKEELLQAEREGWLQICEVAKVDPSLERALDLGEAEAIVLARREKALILLDELEAREKATALGLKVMGSVGCLILAKEKGYIPAVRPYLDRMIEVSFFRLSESLYQQVIKAAGES